MKLVCSQIELNTALQLVGRAVSSRPTHPVLANVLLTADVGTGKLSLTGFDLNLGIQTSFNAQVEKSGAITLPAKLFSEMVSRLSPDSPITLNCDENQEKVDLISLNGNYQMRAMSAEDFPELPLVQNASPLQINPNTLLTSIKSTLFASSSDEAKQLLTGINLSFELNSIESAATDGHRLAVLKISDIVSLEAEDNNLIEDFSVTLPSRSLREVEKLITYWNKDEPIQLFFDKGQVVFLASNQILTTRTLEGVYPNYNQLVPDSFNRQLTINRSLFISALERIAVLADQHNNVIKISIDNSSEKLLISTDAQDIGSGSESIPAKLNGDSIEIAFNARYLLDGLKAIDSENVILKCNAPTTPAVLSPDNDKLNFIYLVMPIQIRS